MVEEYDEYYRSVSDLLDIYEEEPNIQDLFVEGEYDKVFFEYFFDSNGIHDITIYDISTIKVSKDYSDKLSLSLNQNKKNQVITLAFELFEKMETYHQVKCVVDKDFDEYLLDSLHEWETLLYTDYTSREIYFLNPKTIKKFIKLGLYGLPINENEIIKNLVIILQEIFLIKLVSLKNQINCKELPFSNKKRCPSSNFQIDFNRNKYIEDYFGVRLSSDKFKELEYEIEEARQKLSNDYRNNIRGHDFPDLFSHFLNCNYKKKFNKKKRKFDKINLESTLYCCIDMEDLKKEILFKKILKWAKN